MHGPEKLGCVIFSLSNIQEHDVPTGPLDTSGGSHTLRLSGELFLGITRRNNSLPRDIWDRRRSGGLLSDGMTRVWWIIHDTNISGRMGERYFEVLFTKRHYYSSTTDQSVYFERWRDYVKEQWEQYLRRRGRSVARWVARQYPDETLPTGWETQFLADLRRYQMDDICAETQAMSPEELLESGASSGHLLLCGLL
ncbi:hypothetical protein DHEL01_v210012 [Diaporthe helianthi]|uniref:Uncharacterized protein n=1 Tax=Diaporthe helianthi TaxID=158607 RepID=A0A2P5HMW3_DIAHE|nr:hypothetical protein DHEL01_v210012 [Diaporthe helianthi]